MALVDGERQGQGPAPSGGDREAEEVQDRAAQLRARLGARSIVLVGMMGAGKTSVGRRLARQLHAPFVDADEEIERAAGKTVAEIFADHGEASFRDGERRVIARLLREGGPKVLATGGGAFMDAETRGKVAECGVSIWLQAGIDTLLKRVGRRGDRPLLRTADPQAVLRRLLDLREPVYAEADIHILSEDVTHREMVERIIDALETHAKLDRKPGTAA